MRERKIVDPICNILWPRLIFRGPTTKKFLGAPLDLYGDMSEKAAHKVAQFAPELPEYNNVEEIQAMLKCVGIRQDAGAVLCIQIVLEPFGLPNCSDDDDDEDLD